MHAALRRAAHTIRRISAENIPIYAANAAFFLLLSLFPALLLLMSALRPLHLEQAAQTLLLEQLIPQVLQPLIYYITEDLAGMHTGGAISVSAVLTLWSASRGVYGLLKGLNRVYHVREHRSYLRMRLIALLYTALFLLAILGTLSLCALGGRLLHLFPAVSPLSRLLLTLLRGRGGVALLFLGAVFAAVFRVFPDCQSTWRQVLPGSALAALGWILFSWLFSIYATRLSNYSRIYGSVALIAFAMLWLYICLEIVLYGGLLNYYLLRRSKQKHAQDWKL